MGVGRKVLEAAIAEAARLGKKLVTMDTRTGDVAEPLYEKAGFLKMGVIPCYAFNPDGRALHDATFMYKPIEPQSQD